MAVASGLPMKMGSVLPSPSVFLEEEDRGIRLQVHSDRTEKHSDHE